MTRNGTVEASIPLHLLVHCMGMGVRNIHAYTRGKGKFTQQVDWEFIEGSETIHLPFTQQVRGGYF